MLFALSKLIIISLILVHVLFVIAFVYCVIQTILDYRIEQSENLDTENKNNL